MDHEHDEIILVSSEETELGLISEGNASEKWIVDSGATQHMGHKIENFSNYRKLDSSVKIQVGDGKTIEAIGIGDVKFNFYF